MTTSPSTGNPIPATHRSTCSTAETATSSSATSFPARQSFDGEYDLVIASQPYRARSSAEHKVRTVVAPLATALAPGGRMIGIHAPATILRLEIIRGVWPDENPFVTGRDELLASSAAPDWLPATPISSSPTSPTTMRSFGTD